MGYGAVCSIIGGASGFDNGSHSIDLVPWNACARPRYWSKSDCGSEQARVMEENSQHEPSGLGCGSRLYNDSDARRICVRECPISAGCGTICTDIFNGQSGLGVS